MVNNWNKELTDYAVQTITRILEDKRIGLLVEYDERVKDRVEKQALNAEISEYITTPENYQRFLQKILGYLDERFLALGCPKTRENFSLILKANEGLTLAWRAFQEIKKEDLENAKMCQQNLHDDTMLKM